MDKEKAKAYDEALKRARKIHNETEFDYEKGMLEEIFPELKESEDERRRDEDVRKFMQYIEKQAKAYAINLPNRSYDIYAFAKDILVWLEKQGVQRSVDKVEPKFKVGDWITNGDYTWKIVEVKPLDYILQLQDGNIVDDTISHVDEHFHSFTIKDAKDGDVLARNNDVLSICIFSRFDGINNKYSFFSCHCGLEGEGLEQELSINGYHDDSKDYVPATKEQRDLLFSKMHEAGYEWDAENKELKKIEYEIEIPFGAKNSELQEVTYYIPKGFHAEIDDDKVIIKKGEKPIAWKEININKEDGTP